MTGGVTGDVTGGPAVGIDALGLYTGAAEIGAETLLRGRGLDPERLANIGMQSRSLALPFEDPVTHAVHAGLEALEQIEPADRGRIELLVVSTESGFDLSKSVASYVHRHLDLPRTCRVMDVKQACFGATGAFQLAAGYLASPASPGARALVIATDVAVVDEVAQYSEPAAGTGAVALVVARDPRLLTLDLGAFGNHSFDVSDSGRPGPTFDIADADLSLSAYLDCVRGSLRDYCSRVPATDIRETFAHLVFHTPFAGLVRAAHRMLLRDAGLGAGADADADFARRVEPSLRHPRRVGNMCSGSVFLALCSMLDGTPEAGPERIGLFSYGSGCSAEFYSAVIDDESRRQVRALGIGERLDARRPVDFAGYRELLRHTQGVLVAHENSDVDVDPWLPWRAGDGLKARLLFVGTRGYRRQYRWL